MDGIDAAIEPPDLGLRRQQQLYRRAVDAAEVTSFTIHSFLARTVA
ncbi:hypothetical protein AB0895_34415 [Streptomyces globisporus]